MTVLHSPVGVVVVFSAVADFAAVPAAAFAAAGLGFAGHTPFTVITAASGGTAAEVSGGCAGACGLAIFSGAPACCAGGVPGAACPQASVPNRTHTSQLLRICHFLQDWSFRKLKMPSIKS